MRYPRPLGLPRRVAVEVFMGLLWGFGIFNLVLSLWKLGKWWGE